MRHSLGLTTYQGTNLTSTHLRVWKSRQASSLTTTAQNCESPTGFTATKGTKPATFLQANSQHTSPHLHVAAGKTAASGLSVTRKAAVFSGGVRMGPYTKYWSCCLSVISKPVFWGLKIYPRKSLLFMIYLMPGNFESPFISGPTTL